MAKYPVTYQYLNYQDWVNEMIDTLNNNKDISDKNKKGSIKIFQNDKTARPMYDKIVAEQELTKTQLEYNIKDYITSLDNIISSAKDKW